MPQIMLVQFVSKVGLEVALTPLTTPLSAG